MDETVSKQYSMRKRITVEDAVCQRDVEHGGGGEISVGDDHEGQVAGVREGGGEEDHTTTVVVVEEEVDMDDSEGELVGVDETWGIVSSLLLTATVDEVTCDEEVVTVIDNENESGDRELLKAIEETRRVATTCQGCDAEMESIEALQLHLALSCLQQSQTISILEKSVSSRQLIMEKCNDNCVSNTSHLSINQQPFTLCDDKFQDIESRLLHREMSCNSSHDTQGLLIHVSKDEVFHIPRDAIVSYENSTSSSTCDRLIKSHQFADETNCGKNIVPLAIGKALVIPTNLVMIPEDEINHKTKSDVTVTARNDRISIGNNNRPEVSQVDSITEASVDASEADAKGELKSLEKDNGKKQSSISGKGTVPFPEITFSDASECRPRRSRQLTEKGEAFATVMRMSGDKASSDVAQKSHSISNQSVCEQNTLSPGAGEDKNYEVPPSTKKGEIVLYCMCKQPYDGNVMIQCERCKEWFHGKCVRLTLEDMNSIKCYWCQQCVCSAKEEIDNLKEVVENHESIISNLSNEVTQLKNQAKVTRQSGNNLLVQVQKANDENVRVHLKLKGIMGFQQENQSLIQKIATMETHAESLRSTILSLEDIRRNNLVEIEKLRIEVNTHKEIGEELTRIVASYDNPPGSGSSGIQTTQVKTNDEVNAEANWKKELKSLKVKVKSLEESTNSLMNRNKDLNDQNYCLQVELQREKQINNVLLKFKPTSISVATNLRSNSCSAAEPTSNGEDKSADKSPSADKSVNNGSTKDDMSAVNATVSLDGGSSKKACCATFLDGMGACKDQINCKDRHILDFKKIHKGVCFKKFAEPDSCPKGDACQFTHDIPVELREDKEFVEHINQRKAGKGMGRRDDSMKQDYGGLSKAARLTTSERDTGGDVIGGNPCLSTFQNGQGSCKNSKCTDSHNLDFSRLKKGVCFFEFFGSCNRNDKCWFSHEIPSKLRHDARFTESMKNIRNSKLREQGANNDVHTSANGRQGMGLVVPQANYLNRNYQSYSHDVMGRRLPPWKSGVMDSHNLLAPASTKGIIAQENESKSSHALSKSLIDYIHHVINNANGQTSK